MISFEMMSNDLRTHDFDYTLPPELIALRPLERRDASRMMVVERATASINPRQFADFPSYLRDGDLVVLNDTKVVPARFHSDDERVELLRLGVLGGHRWRCLAKPGRRLRQGATVFVGGSRGVVETVEQDGTRVIAWEIEPDASVHGHLALPPYLNRDDDADDVLRYQTVFSKENTAGAIAAPTAGLHFTTEMLARIPHAFLTLHVGVGTFQPVRTEFIKDHQMHSERFAIPLDTVAKVRHASRVIAVGTTVARALESAGSLKNDVASTGETSIFIRPGFDFRVVGALLTNFHLPKSTLLMLVSAFAGCDLIRRAYGEAIHERYRFYSYGDCMLIL